MAVRCCLCGLRLRSRPRLRFRRGEEIGERVGCSSHGWLVGSRQSAVAWKWQGLAEWPLRRFTRQAPGWCKCERGPRCVGAGRDLDSSWCRRRGRGTYMCGGEYGHAGPFLFGEVGTTVGSRRGGPWSGWAAAPRLIDRRGWTDRPWLTRRIPSTELLQRFFNQRFDYYHLLNETRAVNEG